MNNKGYTLIEIIAVIAIVATVGIFGAIRLEKVISSSKEDKYETMISDIKSAADTYFTIYSEYEEYSNLKTELYDSPRKLVISIETLQSALLVDKNIKNPKDNTSITGCVVMTYNGSSIAKSVCPYEGCTCE